LRATEPLRFAVAAKACGQLLLKLLVSFRKMGVVDALDAGRALVIQDDEFPTACYFFRPY
jgi:hypothetical protein